MQTYNFFWYAGATPDFVWQAGTSILVDVFEDHSTAQNDVLFRFRNVIDNGYDEGGIVNLFMDTGSAGGLFTDVSIGARSAGALLYNPGDLDPANLDAGQISFLQFGRVALTPELGWGRAASGLTSGVNPGEFLSLRANLAAGADITDVIGAMDLGLAGNYTDAPYWGQMTSEELATYKADASAGLRFGMLYHSVVPNSVDPDGHGLYVTGSLAGVSDDPGEGANDDELVGTSGNNTLDGGAGADVMAGLAGDDTYHVDNFDDWVIEAAGQGTDTIVLTVSIMMPANVENLVLHAISAEGNELNNVIAASNGNNYIDGAGGIDTISYADAPGPVKVSVSLVGLQSTMSSGSDMVLNFENLTGSAYDDTLSGNHLANVIDGGAGVDTMSGGAGDDTYIVDNAGDVTTGEAGGADTVRSSVNWTLATGFENLVLTGSAASGTGNSVPNRLTGNAAANVLTGMGGNDILDGGTGNDQMIGGAGNDTYVVDSAGDVVTELSGEGTDTVESGSSYTLGTNLEKLMLTGSGANTGTGNTLYNTLTGNAAANSLYGLAGNDTLDGAGGADQMFGSTGSDTYMVDNAGDVVTEASGEGTDTVKSSITYTLGTNVEKLTLTGTAGIAGTGNDLANTLTGNTGNNQLDGGAGNDILAGSNGLDTLIGGLGADKFDFNALIDSVVGAGRDLVLDFSRSQGDRIDLLTIDANTLISGNQVFTFVGDSAFSGVAGQVRAVVGGISGGTLVQGDVNGDGLADFEVGLVGLNTAMVAGDFVL